MKFLPYEEEKPYIFVSYSHTNQEIVTNILEVIYDKGYNIWYDTGISVGSDPFEYIATHLLKCELAIFFLSNNSSQSHYCKSEINFAISKSKNIICVVLDEFDMPLGLEMQLQNTQMLYYYKMSPDDFYYKLFSSNSMKALYTLNQGTFEEKANASSKYRLKNSDAINLISTSGMLVIGDDIHEISPDAFIGRTDLKKVILGKNIVAILDNAFANCINLVEVILNSKLEFISSSAFKGCINLNTIECNSPYFSIENEHFLIHSKKSVINTIHKHQTTNYHLPSKVLFLEKYSIEGDELVENIVIPEGLEYVANHAIANCMNLKLLSLPYSIKYMGNNAILNCPSVTIECYVDTYVEKYCKTKHLPYKIKKM